jgi:hypothetical protein
MQSQQHFKPSTPSGLLAVWVKGSIIAMASVTLAAGVWLLAEGFLLTLHPTLCGIRPMLMGMLLSLAGGYHLYCLELSRTTPERGWARCVVMYALALAVALWASTIFQKASTMVCMSS